MQIKDKIKKITENYKQVFPEDYKATCLYIKKVRKAMQSTTGIVKGTDFLQRRIGEFPEILYDMLQQGLTPEENASWKNDKKHKISNWFFSTYPEFRLINKNKI